MKKELNVHQSVALRWHLKTVSDVLGCSNRKGRVAWPIVACSLCHMTRPSLTVCQLSEFIGKMCLHSFIIAPVDKRASINYSHLECGDPDCFACICLIRHGLYSHNITAIDRGRVLRLSRQPINRQHRGVCSWWRNGCVSKSASDKNWRTAGRCPAAWNYTAESCQLCKVRAVSCSWLLWVKLIVINVN